MASKIRSVKFAWNSITFAASTAATSFGTITFSLPGLSGLSLISAYLEVGATCATTNVSVTSLTLTSVVNGGTARTTANQFSTAYAATGEDMYINLTGVDVRANIISDLNTDGSPNTYALSITPTVTGGLESVTAVLVINYYFDDADENLLKTVALPLESLVGALPTTETVFSAIPQLTGVGGILPENSATVVDWFIVIEGNTSVPGTTDYTIRYRIDTLTTTIGAQYESSGQTANYFRHVYKPANGIPDTTTTHDFKMWSDVANLWNHCAATLYVTYTYVKTGTTRILNSLVLPIEAVSPLGTAVTEVTKFSREIIITEPGVITMRNSGVKIHYNTNNAVSFRMKVGSQAYRTYTSSGGVVAGGFCLQQRLDAGSAQGAALTLVRGANQIDTFAYGSSTTVFATNLGGYYTINYESDVPAAGIHAASHTIYGRLYDTATYALDRTITGTAPFSNIYSSSYFVQGLGFQINFRQATAGGGFNFNVEDPTDDVIHNIYVDVVQTDAESGFFDAYASGKNTFKRYPEDPTSNMNLFSSTALPFRLNSSFTTGANIIAIACIHTMTFTAAGNISGNNAALPTTVKLIRADTDEVVYEQVLSAGTTAFSFTVRDNILDYYVDAYQDDTHVGRSGLAKAA